MAGNCIIICSNWALVTSFRDNLTCPKGVDTAHTHTHTDILCMFLLQIKPIYRYISSFTVSENDCVLFPVVWDAKWVVISHYSKN